MKNRPSATFPSSSSRTAPRASATRRFAKPDCGEEASFGARRARSTMLTVAGLGLSSSVHASLPPDKMNAAAFYVAWFIVIFVPVVCIALFLMVHMLPEKVAEKRQHPQKQAIKTLTILSLVFGGMLWPICWLWAYTRPIGYRAVYGTSKHEDYYYEMGEQAEAGKLSEDELTQLREEMDAMAKNGPLPLKLRLLRKELEAIHAAEAERAVVHAVSARPDVNVRSV